MPDKRAEEIRARQAVIRADLDTLEQVEEPTDDERTRADDLLGEWDDLVVELEPLAAREDRIAKVREAARQEANREVPQTPDLVVRRSTLDPFADLDSVRTHMLPAAEVRARAAAAIERYAARDDQWALDADAAEHVTQLISKRGKNFGKGLAEQILITGSPEYLAAFEAYLTDPGGFSARAAMSLTPSAGGYLVPFTLDPTIILTNAGSANPYRQVANVKTTTTNDWNGVTSAGVNASWTAEAVEHATNDGPTVGQLKIIPAKADAFLTGSYEVLGDSDFAVQLPELLADAKDRIEETAFAVGTGSGQPKGVITAGTLLTAAGTGAAGPVGADVYALSGALPARWRGPTARNVWLGNLTTINRLRNVPAFTGATTSIVNDSGPVPAMLGKPLLESTSIATPALSAKVLVYMDARQFYIVDRIGMSVMYDPMVLGANRRPTGEGGWYAFWRTGADVSTATAVRVLGLPAT